MDYSSQSIVDAAIYGYYSNSLHLSIVSFCMRRNGTIISACKDYAMVKNRASLVGLMEFLYTRFKTQEYIRLSTESTYIYNSITRRAPQTGKNIDLLKLLDNCKKYIPNLEVELVDDNILLTECKKLVINKLKDKSIAKHLLENLMFNNIGGNNGI